jgi:ribosomal protein S18 acetylase RimI-like enzyme
LKEIPGLVRAATTDDAVAIARVHAASWAAAIGRAAGTQREASAVAQWKARLRERPTETLVLEMGGELLGFSWAGQSPDPDAVPGRTAELFALYVTPEAWGRGAGRRLWQATRRRLIEESFTEITLWVIEANFRARAIYERLGFAHENAMRRDVEFGGETMPEVRYRMALRRPGS